MYKKIILLLFTCFAIICKSNLNANIDSLKKALNLSKSEIEKTKTYLSISTGYQDKNIDTSLHYAAEALQLAKKTSNNGLIVKAASQVATIYKYKGMFDDAIQTMTFALQIINKKEEKVLHAECLYILGELNRASFQLETAIYYLTEAKKIFSEINNIAGTAKTYNRIAATLYEQQKLEDALSNVENSNNLINHSLDSSLLANNYEIIGAIKRNFLKNEEAIDYFMKASNINKAQKNYEHYINNLINIGISSYELKKYNDAIYYLEDALNLSIRLNIASYKISTYELLSKCNYEKGSYKSAYNYLDSCQTLKNELFMEEQSKKIMEINLIQQSKHKEQENYDLAEELKGKNKNIKRQRIMLSLSIVFSIVVTILGLIFLKNRQQNQQDKQSLAEKNKKIKEQATELREMNEQLVELNRFKEGLSSMLIHSLKNPLNNIINISSSYSQAKQIKIVKQASIYMMNIVNDILDLSRFENAKVVLSRSIFLLDEVVQSAIEQVEILMLQKNLRLKNKIEENYQLKLDKNIIERVIINLLINAIRYSPQNAEIEIREEKQEDKIKITVKDYGPGISRIQAESFFDMQHQIKTLTHDKRGGGIGMAFCKIAVEAHKGNISFVSHPGKSTEFTITLPFDLSEAATSKKMNKPEEKELIDISGKAILKPFVYELNKYNVYEVSQIRNVLKKIEAYDNFKIKNWKSEIDEALYNCNQEKYQELVNLILK